MLLRGGAGLGGILLIGGLLYYTGAGSWMLDRMQQLENQCYSAVSTVGFPRADPACRGIGQGVNAITSAAESIGSTLHSLRTRFDANFGTGGHFEGLSALMGSLQQNMAGLSSSTDHLEQMIGQGPRQLTGGDLNQQFQRAVDSFTIGQNYASSGNAAQAIPWLQQGARQPEGFGLMSQLSLGDLYRTGGGGVSADPAQSEAYYRLASNSLGQLSQSNNAQSQQLLRTLPASPQAIQQQLQQTIASMRRGVR